MGNDMDRALIAYRGMASVVKFLIGQLRALQVEYQCDETLSNKIGLILSQADYMADRVLEQVTK